MTVIARWGMAIGTKMPTGQADRCRYEAAIFCAQFVTDDRGVRTCDRGIVALGTNGTGIRTRGK
ncbi:MAG: hypothetical protein KGO83_03220 [Paenibacillaceae bacterium]|nr:hypothetical protein [Paenibacillaceae bacterium]